MIELSTILVFMAVGFGIGLVGVIPVGPANIMVISRSLRGGFWGGLAPGLGTWCADMIFVSIILFSVKWLSKWILDHQLSLQIAGGLILLIFGLILILKDASKLSSSYQQKLQNNTDASKSETDPMLQTPQTDETGKAKTPFWRGFLTAFAITLSNPGPLLYFAGTITPLGLLLTPSEPSFYDKTLPILIGIASGNMLWWIALATGVGFFHEQLSPQTLIKINTISGTIIFLLGLALLLMGAFSFSILEFKV